MPKAAKRIPQKVVKRAIPKAQPRRKIVTDKDKTAAKRENYPLAEQGQPADKAPAGKEAETPALPPDFYMTEQEKAGQQAPVADDEAPKKKETK